MRMFSIDNAAIPPVVPYAPGRWLTPICTRVMLIYVPDARAQLLLVAVAMRLIVARPWIYRSAADRESRDRETQLPHDRVSDSSSYRGGRIPSSRDEYAMLMPWPLTSERVRSRRRDVIVAAYVTRWL